MGRFETLMYDNRNWKGTIALIASMLIGLAVGFKGYDELPDLQNERRASSVAVYKARRVLDKQFPNTLAHDRAKDQLRVAEARLVAANMGIRLSNITFGVGLAILGISLVLYLRRTQGISVAMIEPLRQMTAPPTTSAPGPTRLAA